MSQTKDEAEARVIGVRTMSGYIVVSLVVGLIVPHIDVPFAWMASPVGNEQVIAFLSSVSSGMMAFTGIVFSLLFLLLQFGSTAYTPRIVGILGRNRVIYHAGGVFTGTFLYSLMALRGVGIVGADHTEKLTIWVAFAWLIASVLMLLRLTETLTALTHTRVLYLLSETCQREIARLYGPSGASDPAAPREAMAGEGEVRPLPVEAAQIVVHDSSPRYVVNLDVARLVELARASDAVIRIPLARGDSVAAPAPLAFVHGSGAPVSESQLRDAIHLGRDREIERDPKYALRLLVDIAVHALSPGIGDPTTAVQVLDHLESLLVRLGNADLDVGHVRDSSGSLRVVYEATAWEDYLDLAVAEIQKYGEDAPQNRATACGALRLSPGSPPEPSSRRGRAAGRSTPGKRAPGLPGRPAARAGRRERSPGPRAFVEGRGLTRPGRSDSSAASWDTPTVASSPPGRPFRLPTIVGMVTPAARPARASPGGP